MTSHDELCAVVLEADAQSVYQLVLGEMTRPLAWLPSRSLAAEGLIQRGV